MGDLVGVRSEETDSVTFTSGSLSLMVTTVVSAHHVRVDGWVTSPGAEVDVVGEGVTRTVTADGAGRFSVEEIPRGRAHFVVRRDGYRPVITPVHRDLRAMRLPARTCWSEPGELRLAGLAHNSAGRPHRAARSLRAALALLPTAGRPRRSRGGRGAGGVPADPGHVRAGAPMASRWRSEPAGGGAGPRRRRPGAAGPLPLPARQSCSAAPGTSPQAIGELDVVLVGAGVVHSPGAGGHPAEPRHGQLRTRPSRPGRAGLRRRRGTGEGGRRRAATSSWPSTTVATPATSPATCPERSPRWPPRS